MSDLDNFMAENKPTYRSKLQPYLDDIRTLWQNGYSEPDILRYLSEKKMLVVTRKTLHSFILKNIHSKEAIVANQEKKELVLPNTTIASESTQVIQQTNTTLEQDSSKPTKTTIKKGIKKFEWKNATTEGLI